MSDTAATIGSRILWALRIACDLTFWCGIWAIWCG
jgi:hypothetical protein